jgi:hypothetical protein
VVEEFETGGMERREERHVRILSNRIAQGERAVRCELSKQAIGDRLQALVFFCLFLVRGVADLRFDVFDRSLIDSVPVRRASLVLGFWNRWLVFWPNIAGLHTQSARTVDADEGASPPDFLGVILDRPIIEPGKCRQISPSR